MEWLLETALLGLLAATLFHAMRLERALGVLKRDRAALEDLVVSFNSSTRAAEQGIERLHAAAEGAGRQVQRQAEVAAGLKEDLLFLTERGERLADRLDLLVRAARPLAQEAAPEPPPRLAERLHAERPPAERLHAERQPAERPPAERLYGERLHGERSPAERPHPDDPEPSAPRLRSQAERDLLRALRSAR